MGLEGVAIEKNTQKREAAEEKEEEAGERVALLHTLFCFEVTKSALLSHFNRT